MIHPFQPSPCRLPFPPSLAAMPANPQLGSFDSACETYYRMKQTLESLRLLVVDTAGRITRMPGVSDGNDPATSPASQRLPAFQALPPATTLKPHHWASVLRTSESTEDGHGYVNGMHGAFIAMRSDSGDFEVQKLHASTPLDPLGIYNVAVAVKVHGDVVQFDARRHVLLVNGARLFRKEGLFPLPNGGTLQMTGNRLVVSSALGDCVEIWVGSVADGSLSHTLNLQGKISAERPPGSVKGALGICDGDDLRENDLVLRNGEQVSLEERLKFLASWRVPPEESLFS